MDLAVYISELLGLHGEVNLPGIGRFSQVRVNGYYNEKEKKFYPPGHTVSFDPQLSDDDGLAQYIANKKNISLASAKYFIDKYVSGIKQQAASKSTAIAGLGELYTDGSQLAFKTNNSRDNDAAFFGFPAVDIHPAIEKEKPVVNLVPPVKEEVKPELPPELPTIIEDTTPKHPREDEEITEEERISDEPVLVSAEPFAEGEEYYDGYPPKRSTNVWVALLLIVIIALLILLGLFKYKPDWFQPRAELPNKAMGADTAKVTNKPDSTRLDTTTAAIEQQTINSLVDTFATLHYEIQAGAFRTLPKIKTVISEYQKMGLKPKVLKHAQGDLYKVSLGTYFNKEQAEKAEDSILRVTKIDKSRISLIPYLPKK